MNISIYKNIHETTHIYDNNSETELPDEQTIKTENNWRQGYINVECSVILPPVAKALLGLFCHLNHIQLCPYITLSA